MGTVSETDFGYTGQRALGDLGLMDYHARMYDAALGRFIQPDSVVPDTVNPQAWDRYAYTLNNPIRYNDPTGHRNCEEDDFNCPGSSYTTGDNGKKGGGGGSNANSNRPTAHSTCSGDGNWDDGPQCLYPGSTLSIVVGNTKYQKDCPAGKNEACPGGTTGLIAFAATGIFTAGTVDYALASGALADGLNSAYLAAKPALMPLYIWLSTFFTHNPDSQTVSIGSFDPEEVNGYIETANKAGNQFTYYSMHPIINKILDAVGLAEPINEGFMANQISQGKDFVSTVLGDPGSGYIMERQMLLDNAYSQISSAWTGFRSVFQPPAVQP